MGSTVYNLRRNYEKENVSPVMSKKKRMKLGNDSLESFFDESLVRPRPFASKNINVSEFGCPNVSFTSCQSSLASIDQSPAVTRVRPLSKRTKDLNLVNISYMSSSEVDDSISSCHSSPVQRRMPFRKTNQKRAASFTDLDLDCLDVSITDSITSELSLQICVAPFRKPRDIPKSVCDVSYASSRADSVRSADTTFTSPNEPLPFRARRLKPSLANVSYENSVNGSLDESIKVKRILRHKQMTDRTAAEISYASSQESLANTEAEEQNDTATNGSMDILTPSQENSERPFRKSRFNSSAEEATYAASQETLANNLDKNSTVTNDSMDVLRQSQENLKRPFRKSRFNSSAEEATYAASPESLGKNSTVNDTVPNDDIDILTPSQDDANKKRPFSKAPLNCSIKDATYMTSQEFNGSLDDTPGHLPFTQKLIPFRESFPEVATPSNSQNDRSRDETYSSCLRRSVRLANKTLTPNVSSDSLQLRPCSVFLTDISNLEKRQWFGKRGKFDTISFSGISYQESSIDSSTRSEAQPSESESESESEEESEDKMPESIEEDDQPESVHEEIRSSLLEDGEMRDASMEQHLALPATLTIPPRDSTFDPSESLKDDDAYSCLSLINATIIPAEPLSLEQRVQQKIEAILKQAEEYVVNRCTLMTNRCQSSLKSSRARPQKRPVQQRQGILRPKLFKPGQWANKRLYDHLGQKLRPEFGLQFMLKAEEVVKIINKTVRTVEKSAEFERSAVDRLKLELATLHIIETTNDFYQFIRSFLSKSCQNKMIPCMQPFKNIIWPPKYDTKWESEKILD